MSNLPSDQVPRYMRFLCRDIDPSPTIDLDDPTLDIQINMFPFTHVIEKFHAFNPGIGDALGFQVDQACCKLLGTYTLKVANFYTFYPEQVAKAVNHYATQKTPPMTVTLRFVLDKKAQLTNHHPPSFHICALNI
eukprot:scaffold3505_cov170-Amphora_coffeaeformis.AAC.1